VSATLVPSSTLPSRSTALAFEEQGIGQAGLARGAVPHECNAADVLAPSPTQRLAMATGSSPNTVS
jgi:hypothetical protein